MITYLRDDLAGIPFPAMWDLAGGGAEPGETPTECVLRETSEEFGLTIAPKRIIWARAYPSVLQAGAQDWFMVAYVTEQDIDNIRFGQEGQHWRMMTCAEFCAHPAAIPHLQIRLLEYLGNKTR